MPEDSHDHLADALSRLSDGHVIDPNAEPDDSQGEPAEPDQGHPEPIAEAVSSSPAPAPVPMRSSPSPRRELPDALRPGTPQHTALNIRRTMIPVLLTLGTVLPILGIATFLVDEDSPLRQLRGSWVPLTLLIVGPILLFFGVLNMLQVKNILQESHQEMR